MKHIYLILACVFFTISFAFADGTKQLMPNRGADADGNPQPKGNCYIVIGAQEGGNGPSRPFARYNPDGTSADPSGRLYINIRDYTTETIRFGFSDIFAGEKSGDDAASPTMGATYKVIDHSDYSKLKFRIKDPSGNVVYAESSMPTSGHDGYIDSYAEAYYGPKNGSNGGYDYLELQPTMNGDYYIEFCNNHDIGTSGSGQNATIIGLFDVSVCDKSNNYAQKEGRLWSYAWGLNTDGSSNKTYTTFYTISTDHYVSKVYLAGWEPYQFVIACNSFGSRSDKDLEENRRSYNPGKDPSADLPEYKVFLTQPSAAEWGEAHVPNVPDHLSFAGDAMTCEDLIFVVKLLYNENATLELYMDTDADGINDKVIAALLEANKISDRGFHYPWKDQTELKETGQLKYYYIPSQVSGCKRIYSLSLFDQSYEYKYTYVDQAGTEYPNTKDRVNPGDTMKLSAKPSEISFSKTLGTGDNPILISTYDELLALATAVSNGTDYEYTIKDFYRLSDGTIAGDETFTITNEDGFKDVYFFLTASTGKITLDSNWPGIGTLAKPFKGIFRAGRYNPNPVADNLDEAYKSQAGDQDTITMDRCKNALFNYCNGATIDNIHIKGSLNLEGFNINPLAESEESDNQVWCSGGICSYAVNTEFSHCTNSCTINSAPGYAVGGIVGYADGCSIDSCSNFKSIDSQSIYSGGIFGYLKVGTHTPSVEYCYNVGTIQSETERGPFYLGGIGGKMEGSSSLVSCINDGAVECPYSYSGGILGGSDRNSIYSCMNNGYVDGVVVAGITAQSSGGTILYCVNEGDLFSYGDIVDDNEVVLFSSNSYSIANNTTSTIKYSISTEGKREFFDGDGNRLVLVLDGAGGINLMDAYIAMANGIDSPFILDGGILEELEELEEETEEISVWSCLDGDCELRNIDIECCGSSFYQGDAGRLFNSNTTFYIKWDGKDNDGECVTGDVTVNYQKNSGVTHFPFYDPENNDAGQGLVVYRISPIQDSIKNVSSENQTEYQADHNITDPSYYRYQELPKDYYQTSNTNSGEYGIELKLFWDDEKNDLTKSGKCSREVMNGFIFGEELGGKIVYKTTKYCTSFNSKHCKSTGKINGKVSYCKSWKNGYSDRECGWTEVKTKQTSPDSCAGINNLAGSKVWDYQAGEDGGGYLGSTAGGHLFPIDNYGNEKIINTWWNGVEVKNYVPLKLTANEPAILMPITISKWTATSLEQSVLLEWTTASEENNDYFTIERSIDGVRWVSLGTVKGFGTTSVAHDYSFEDMKPVAGISYYRLKQTDYNGAYTYSSIKCINRPSTKNNAYKVYSIANEDVFVVEGESIAACEIEVFNTLGVKVSNISFYPTSTSRVVIDVKNLPLGTYIIKSCNTSKQVIKNW